jgi:hypothetical protein
MFKPIVVSENQFRAEQPVIQEADVKRVFMVMHGYYGNLFLSKFSTGSLDDKGEDQGIANARRIWAHGLKAFDAETIKAALRECQSRHPEYPPSLPQFSSLCAAMKPRATFNPGPAAIGMSGQLRSQYAARARAINEKHAERKARIETGYVPIAPGLDGLKQAIASAVGAAGGDEAKALRRLETMFQGGKA